MRLLRITILLAAAAAALAGALAERAPAAPKIPDPVCVPDVVGQFRDLKHHGEALGFHLPTGTPTPTLYRHYQGIQRLPGPGRPYFFVTRSGNDSGPQDPELGDDPGNFHVVRFDSRGTTGERLRSNRLVPGQDTEDTPPPMLNRLPRDRVVTTVSFDGTGWPGFGHPGGIQIFGDVVPVPLEHQYGTARPHPRIVLVDVANPESPTRLRDILLADDQDKAGVAAILRRPENGKLLLLVTGAGNETLHLYESNVADIRDPSLRFTRIDVWKESELVGGEWPTGTDSHQHLYLVRDCEGGLFMLGTLNTAGGGTFPGNEDRAYLYAVSFDANGEFQVEQRNDRHLWCSAHEVGRICDFAAGGGFHVTPAGELILYATEHENGGPDDTVRMAEFRSATVFRPGSPNLAPTAAAGGPYAVDEGGTFAVDGRASTPQLARAWAELYDDTSYRDRSIVLDWDDRFADDFDDLDALDDFEDKASSVIFRAPVGCDLYLFEDESFNVRDRSARQLVLAGTGGVVRVPNLDSAAYNFGDEASSVQLRGATCPATTLSFAWEPGRVSGATATLRPTVDGPGTETILLQACGPFLVCDDDRVTLQVRNVAPTITSLTVPAQAAEATQILVTGAFTDVSMPDRLATVTLDWGDGTTDTRGDTLISLRHRYADNGSYTVRAQVCDPDGACDTEQRTITVTNVAPTVSAGNDATLQEGASLALSSGFSDPGYSFAPARTLETFAATVDWGDGKVTAQSLLVAIGGPNQPSAGTFFPAAPHRYADQGTYSVRVTVTDDDGGSASDTLVATVTNAAPTAAVTAIRDETGRTLAPGDVVPAGTRVDVTGTYGDPGAADTHTATINWGDGFSGPATLVPATRTVTASHVYATAAALPRTITLTVIDDEGAAGTGTAPVLAVTPAAAVSDAIADLNPLANAPTILPAAHVALRRAQDDLDGSTGGQGTDGALDRILADDLPAAAFKLRVALQDLASAEAADPAVDADAVESLVVLAAKAVARAAVAEAQALNLPVAAPAIADAQTLVGEGDALLAAPDLVGAASKYELAVRRLASFL